MGWSGYTIYSGDGTQTRHYDFLKWAKVASEDEVFDNNWLQYNKTVVPKDKISILVKNIGLIVNKIPKFKFLNEDSAIEWQMLAALLLDNKIKVPKLIKQKAKEATEYLIQESGDFDKPYLRRKHLRKFLEKLNNN